jgi:large subunit ribosomal protein L35
MNKPIYRHLADKKWREYNRKVLMQRITQMTVIPDVLPHIDPTYSTDVWFSQHKVPHGDFVFSTTSETPPTLNIQPYDKGQRLVSIVVINPDVPNVEKDGFDYRCHFLACNIPLSPTQTRIDLSKLNAETQIIQPWLPPYVQKGLPYQRHALFIFEQNATATRPEYLQNAGDATLDLRKLRELLPQFWQREDFILRSFMDKLRIKPVGVDLFRAKWDEGTRGVMERSGVIGADVEFKRKRVEPLPYQRLKGDRFG